MLRTSDNKIVNPKYIEKMWVTLYSSQYRVTILTTTGNTHYLVPYYETEKLAETAIESIVTRYWSD